MIEYALEKNFLPGNMFFFFYFLNNYYVVFPSNIGLKSLV